MSLPANTTWLDIATLAIAVVGLLIAALSLALTVRRDRQLGKVALRLQVELDDGYILIRLTNTERRPVTVETAGISSVGRIDRTGFTGWDRRNLRRSETLPMIVGDAPLPKRLDPGDPTYQVRAPLYRIKNHFHPQLPGWAYATDSYGQEYWMALDGRIQGAICATRRRVRGPDDDYGHSTTVDVDDAAQVAPEDLIDW